MTASPDQPQRRRRWLVWVAIGLAALAAIGMWGIVQSRSHVTVEHLLIHEGEGPNIHPREATAELCRDIGCVEGWRTDVGNYLRFSSQGAAEEWVTYLGDEGRRWETIVLDMRGFELDFEQRKLAIQILFSNHDWA